MKKIFSALLALTFPLSAVFSADSEWIVTPKVSGTGRMMFQVNRGRAAGKIPPVWMGYDPAGRKTYGFLRIGNRGKLCFAGINEKGLAVAYSPGDPTDDRIPKRTPQSWGGHAAVVISLRDSATADQARAKLHQAFRKKLIRESLVVFLVDPRRAIVVECSPAHYASWEVRESYCVYSHMWKLPGMDDGSVRTPGSAAVCTQREWAIREGLHRAFDEGKKTISCAASMAVSRMDAADFNTEEFRKQRGKPPIQFAPYGAHSQDSYLFELDPELPWLLSCIYVAFGPARRTVYLPLALPALKDLPKELLDPEYFDIAAERHKADPAKPTEKKLLEFEKHLHAKFDAARDEARELALKTHKPAEAEKLLVDLAHKQAAETLRFLRDLK